MRIFVTGATGLVGRRLVVDRLGRGDRVVVLSRDAARAERLFAAGANPNVEVIEGNPAFPGPWQRDVEGCDAVVHLAGAGVADRRWTPAYKRVITESRIDSTHQVVTAIREAKQPPQTLINASAIGFYADTGSAPADETAPSGKHFLAEVCIRWEKQAYVAESLGARVVILRIGIVLDSRGGALAKMTTPFRFFAGGPLGRGRQYMSWIHWRDLVGLVDLALRDGRVLGPINGTAPTPVTGREFARRLGHALGRPSWLPVPPFALRLAAGEMARYLLMSQRVVPAAARDFGYEFVFPELEPALESVLAETDPAESDAAAESDVVSAPSQAASTADDAGGPSQPIRLLAIDVDGTLLRSDLKIAQGVVQACRAADRVGCVVVLASSRRPRALRSIVRTLDIQSPTISSMGALIWNPADDRPQYHESLDASTGQAIVRDGRAVFPELIVAVESLDEWFTDRVDPRYDCESNHLVDPDDTGPLDRFLQSDVTRLNLMAPPEELAKVVEMIRGRFWKMQRVALFQPAPYWVQVTSRLVDKGIALQRIAQRLGAAREAVMAIGDGANDLGMIEWAGFGVAVDNATGAIKQLADAVVPGNDDLGVARAINRYVLGRR